MATRKARMTFVETMMKIGLHYFKLQRSPAQDTKRAVGGKVRRDTIHRIGWDESSVTV